MGYGKKENLLYVGIPSGSLHDQVVRLLEKAGHPLRKGRLYELTSPYDRDVVFRILDRKEMPRKVAHGIVDCGITGKDYIYEAGMEGEIEVIGDFIFSKRTNKPSRLVLATRPETGITTPEGCAGKTIATELPNLTRRRMKELFGTSELNIIHSEGKTEAKVFMVFIGNLGYLVERSFYSDSIYEAHTLQKILERDASVEGISRQLQSLGITHLSFNRKFVFGQVAAIPHNHQRALVEFLKTRGKQMKQIATNAAIVRKIRF